MLAFQAACHLYIISVVCVYSNNYIQAHLISVPTKNPMFNRSSDYDRLTVLLENKKKLFGTTPAFMEYDSFDN